MGIDAPLTSDINPKTYYGRALELAETDKRQVKFRKERDEWGFDSTSLWELDVQIVKFVVDRLKMAIEYNEPLSLKTKLYFKEDSNGRHTHLKENREKSLVILGKIVKGFELYLSSNQKTEQDTKDIDKAFKLFFKYFHGLWY
jgi:hypothetical protein